VTGLDEDQLAAFHDSLERCRAGGRLLDRFYELLVASSPEVADKFRDTDFRRQKRVVMESLYMLIFVSQGREEGRRHLEQVAVQHDREHLDIRPELYDLWLSCLLTAVRECDPRWSPSVELAWIAMLAPGIAMLKQMHAATA
jgi:hemoglobin-like flavoprotein